MIPSLKLLQIDLTDECPLSCLHCSNTSGPARQTSFPIVKLREIISDAQHLQVQSVVFSGGEPLCYPYLGEALLVAQRAGIKTTIFTTGIKDKTTRLPLPRQAWQELKERGLTRAAFSIYAPPKRRHVHNRIVRLRPISGDAFAANEQAMMDARLCGVSVDLHFIPSAETVGDLPDIYAWAVASGFATLHLQVPTKQGRNANHPSLRLNLADELQLRNAASSISPGVNATAFYISRFWQQRWNKSNGAGCAANPEQLVIRADGTVSMCNACKYGETIRGTDNILAPGTNLSAIWKNSPGLEEIRKTRAQGRYANRCRSDVVLALEPVPADPAYDSFEIADLLSSRPMRLGEGTRVIKGD